MQKQTTTVTKPVAATRRVNTARATAPVAAPVVAKAAAKPVKPAASVVAKVIAKVAATPAKAPAKQAPVAAKQAPVAAKVATKAAPVAAPRAAPVHRTAVKQLFVMTDIARPQSGPRLFAHTLAAMTVLGMFGKGRPAVRTTALQAMIGATAIRYHSTRKGTLEARGDTIALTEYGASFFPARKHDKAEAAGFEKLFKTGDGSDVKVRPQHIAPMSLAV